MKAECIGGPIDGATINVVPGIRYVDIPMQWGHVYRYRAEMSTNRLVLMFEALTQRGSGKAIAW